MTKILIKAIVVSKKKRKKKINPKLNNQLDNIHIYGKSSYQKESENTLGPFGGKEHRNMHAFFGFGG